MDAPTQQWEFPPHYYRDVAQADVSGLWHGMGMVLTKMAFSARQGGVRVYAPDSVVNLEEPTIITATHRSGMDIPLFAHATESVGLHHVRAVGKRELMDDSRMRWYYERNGIIAVDRDKPDIDGLTQAQRTLLDRGVSVLNFIEGTRIHTDVRRVRNFKASAMLLSVMSGAPITPLAFAGVSKEINPETEEVVDEDSRSPFFFGLPVVANFGEPIYSDAEPTLDNSRKPTREQVRAARRLSERVHESLQQTLDEAYYIRERRIK